MARLVRRRFAMARLVRGPTGLGGIMECGVRPRSIAGIDVVGCFIDFRYRRSWVIVVGMRTEAIRGDDGAEPAVTVGQNRRKRRFWVPLLWAVVPTLLVTLVTCFYWKPYEFPEPVVGVLFFALVIPAAVICEKLGLGQFSILGGSTIPDWLFFSVMIVLVYLYCFVLVMVWRGVVRLALQARRTVRSEN